MAERRKLELKILYEKLYDATPRWKGIDEKIRMPKFRSLYVNLKQNRDYLKYLIISTNNFIYFCTTVLNSWEIQMGHRIGEDLYSIEAELVNKSQRKLSSGNILDPIHKLRLLCFSRGATGILGLGRTFRNMANGECKAIGLPDFTQGMANGELKAIGLREFTQGIRKTGLDCTDEDIDEIFHSFDQDKIGSINMKEFLSKVRHPMPENRCNIIEKAFHKMDKDNDGVISYDDLEEVYSVNSHPKYVNGDLTKAEILAIFLKHFENGPDKNVGTVTKEEFLNYYAAVSAEIDNDGFFDLLIRKAYSL